MLKSLYIKNYALIDELHLEFKNGLNIITGETGAGKSIIVDAFMTALGERASVNLIRNNEKKAIIEAIFNISDIDIAGINELQDLDINNDNELILRREINLNGNSRSFVNDTPVSLNTLKELGDKLVDFHGQHQHQLLLNSAYHLSALDSIIDFNGKLEKYSEEYHQYKSFIKEAETAKEKAKQDKIKFDHYTFELEEINKISPKEHELEETESKLKIAENAEKLFSLVNELALLLSDSDTSVINNLNAAKKTLNQLKSIDSNFNELYAECESALISLNEISRYADSYKAEFDFDENNIDELKNRFLELNGLKKKYGDYQEVFSRMEFLTNELELISNFDDKIAQLAVKIEAARKAALIKAEDISLIRKEEAIKFSDEIIDKLQYLGMENSKFEVEFKQNANNDLYDSGLDKIDFKISTNKGERLKQLKEVASGGEISRIMLAIKYIISESKQMPMLVFDEIDMGISGKIGQKTGLLMKELARKHQILAITHLPQIAALGDANYYVYKENDGESTVTQIKQLNKDEKIKMIAQMLSGENITDSALENAEELMSYKL